MDFGTIIGVIVGIILLATAILREGNSAIFLSLNSLFIVLGGTFAGTIISYSFAQVFKLPALIRISLQDSNLDKSETIKILVEFAKKARREGLLALEQDVMEVNDSFLQKGIQLVVDGTDRELVKNILETKLTLLGERHRKGQDLFNTMAQLAPAFGMIGTLIGLVQMLSVLEDPSQLGSGMALALLTTLYGALMANLFFIPLANKLKVKSEEEILLKELMIEGILAIQVGENSRVVEEKLNAYLGGKIKEDDLDTRIDNVVVGENV